MADGRFFWQLPNEVDISAMLMNLFRKFMAYLTV